MGTIADKKLSRREMLKAMGVTVAAGVLAACGAPAPVAAPTSAPKPAEAQKPAEANKPAEAAKVTAAAPAPSSKEMILWGLKYDPHIARYEAMAKAFGDKMGVQVTVQPQDDPFGKPLVALAAGTPPDVACVMGKGLPPYLVKNAVMDLTDAVYKAVGTNLKDDWFGDGIPCYTYEGKIYGVPTEVSGISLLAAWNATDIAEADKKAYPPYNGKFAFDTYDQMWELAKKLQKEKDGKVVRYGISSAGWEFSNISSMVAQQGRTWWNADAKTFDFDNAETANAFKYLVETPVKMGLEAEQGDNQTNLAQAGKVAVARGNIAVMFFLKDIGMWFEPVGVPLVDPKKPPKYMGEGGWGFITLPKVKNQGNALEFLKWTASYDGQKSWLEAYTGNYIWLGPLRKTMELPMFKKNGDKYHDAIIDLNMRVAEAQPYQTYFGGLYGYIGKVEEACASVASQIRQGKMTAEQGAKQLQELATNQYKQWQADNAQK